MAQNATNQTYTTTERMNECGYKRGKQPKRKPKIIERTWYTKYVRREHAPAYEQLGWKIDADALRGTTHGEWSVLGIWDGPGDPPLPILRGATEEHKALP